MSLIPGVKVRSTTVLLKNPLDTQHITSQPVYVREKGIVMRFGISIGLTTLWFGAVLAQEPNAAAGKQEKLAELKQLMAKNQAELKQYAWTETTQISLKGE